MNYQPTEEDYEWAARVGQAQARQLHVDGLKDDAAQEARIAVWRGALRYDPKRQTPFRSYVIKRIVGCVKDLIRSEIGRNSQKLCLRNTVRLDLLSPENPHHRGALDDGSKPMLDQLVEQETVDALHEACLSPYEHQQLDCWADLQTQHRLSCYEHLTEAAISRRAKRLRSELQIEFERTLT